MRTDSNHDALWRVVLDTVLDMKGGAIVRPFILIACAAVSVAIVTAGGEITLPPAATMQMGAALMLWMLMTLLLKNSLVRLSLRWTKKGDAAKVETDEKSTRLDHALAYMHSQPAVIRQVVLAPFAALIALAILTNGRFATVQYWRVEAADLAAINDLAPVILALLFTLFVIDSVQYQLARRERMGKRAATHAPHDLDGHLSPEIEQQVRAWAQANRISFSLAVEHLVALGLADVHLQQVCADREWELSFSESRLQQMQEEVRLWI